MDSMRSVEIQARSREEATRLALEQLGARQEDVNVEILAEIEDDFWGEGEVLIRVTLKDGVSSSGTTAGRPASTRQPGGRNRSRKSQRNQRQAPPRQTAPRRPSTVSDEVLQEYEAIAKATVRDLVDLMAINADVMAVDNPSVMPVGVDDPPTVFIDINGPDLGLLIGRRGENLSQIQYLVNLLVNREVDQWVRVIVDVEGYRTRREESLIGLAERVGRQVARNNRPISLEPMPPNERRIVHLTLQDHDDVSTESSGEGNSRRVTISPA